MNPIWIGVSSGLISGLLTSLIVFVLAFAWREHCLPWLEDRIYLGIRIAGSWSLVDKNDKNGKSIYGQLETLELKQKAARLSGHLVLVPKDGEQSKARTLDVEGVVRDGFVLISCVPATRRNFGYQAFLGKVSGDGGQICGRAVYYHIDDAVIDCTEAIYARRDGD